MKTIKTILATSIGLLIASGASAHDHLSPQSDTSLISASAFTPAPVQTSPLLTTEQLVKQQQAQFAKARQNYQLWFAAAYEKYPTLPDGILESLAWVGSRWENRMPESALNHHGMPQPYGLFGLYDDNDKGFHNTLTRVINHSRVSKEQFLKNADIQINAMAAWLESQLVNENIAGNNLEQTRSVLAQLSGIRNKSNIENYAINSFLFDIFSVIEKGADDNGILIAPRNVDWNALFNEEEIRLLRAPGLIIDSESDKISVKGENYYGSGQQKQRSLEQSTEDGATDTINSSDYAPALWVASPNYSSRSGSSISHVAIHTTQGSYSGAISWLANPASSASAHYVIRSSDGQVTQMVRDYNKAWHAKSANPYSIGIEHEGYVSSSSWYTTAMYNSSSDLTKHMCSQHNINCASAYSGSAHSGVVQLSQSYTVKGHQHFPSQTHTDPGIYWNWSSYYSKLNGSSGGGGNPSVTILDDFEASEGHFNAYPTYSGSTQGISSSSTAVRTSSIRYKGSYSEQIKLVDNTSTSASWAVRFLSGYGSTSNNTKFQRANGTVGFWVYSGGSGVTAAIGIDDSDGTERSISRSIPANQWTFLEWELDNSSHWNAWYNGNGSISASQVSIDAIWFYRAQTSYNVYLYIDDVQHQIK